MSILFVQGMLIGCVSLSLLSVAGCSVETGEEDPGDVATIQEALCSEQQMASCGIACSAATNSSCIEGCFSRCGGTGQRLYPWAVGCQGSAGTAFYDDSVIVMAPLRPGEPLMSAMATEMTRSAMAPCDARMRQILRPQCGTLDRAATFFARAGYHYVGVGSTRDYGHWTSRQAGTMPVAELCAGWAPPQEPPCGRRCNL